MHEEKKLPDHYRFRETYHGEGVEIVCDRWVAIKETPEGYWVIPSTYQGWQPSFLEKVKKWVHKRSVRRYCYPDQAEAFRSYGIRKQRQLGHLRLQMAVTEQVVSEIVALNGKLPEHRPLMTRIVCGKPALFDQYNWDLC